MRLRDYLATAGKNIRRQAVRSALTIIAIGISATILVTLVALSFGAKKALVSQLSPDGSLTDIIVTPNRQAGSTIFGSAEEVGQNTHVLNDDDVKRLGNIPHIQFASPTANIWEFKSFRVDGTSKDFVAQAQGTTNNPAIDKPLAAGEHFAPDDKRHVVIIGHTYAKELGFAGNPQALVGKTIVITTQDGYSGDGADIPGPNASKQQMESFTHAPTKVSARIIGVTAEGNTENALMIPMSWARQVRTQNIGPKPTDQIATQGYSTILVKTDSVAAVRPVSEAINNLGFGEISTLEQLDRLMQFSTIMWVILGSITLVALIAASLGVVNTMMMSVAEQRYIIGVLRACGARRAVIAKLFLVEAALLGFLGGIVGVGLGLAAIYAIDQKIALLLKAQNLPVAHVATMPWWLLAGGIVLPMLFGVLSGLYPAYKAAREDPARILAGV
jgi:putative ABC transport system permease protein